MKNLKYLYVHKHYGKQSMSSVCVFRGESDTNLKQPCQCANWKSKKMHHFFAQVKGLNKTEFIVPNCNNDY